MSNLGDVVYEGKFAVAPGLPRRDIVGTLYGTPAGLEFYAYKYMHRFLGPIPAAIAGSKPTADESFVIPWSADFTCSYDEKYPAVLVTFVKPKYDREVTVAFSPYSIFGYRIGTLRELIKLTRRIEDAYGQYVVDTDTGTVIRSSNK